MLALLLGKRNVYDGTNLFVFYFIKQRFACVIVSTAIPITSLYVGGFYRCLTQFYA